MKKRLRIIVLVITLLFGIGTIPKESSVNTLTETSITTYYEEERRLCNLLRRIYEKFRRYQKVLFFSWG